MSVFSELVKGFDDLLKGFDETKKHVVVVFFVDYPDGRRKELRVFETRQKAEGFCRTHRYFSFYEIVEDLALDDLI